MPLPQLPGMQVMHALVGCQKRWTNSMTRRFHSVGSFYEDFAQTTDEEVCDLLAKAANERRWRVA